MNSPTLNLIPALPEIFVLALACVVLLVEAFSKKPSWSYSLTQLTLVGAGAITVLYAEAGKVYAFNGMFVDDLMGDVLKLVAYAAAVIAVAYSRSYLTDRGMFRGEYFALVLFAVLGMMVMISASHFLTLYLGLELLSLSLYTMVALQRDSAVASEASMKYFVLGAVASGFLLYGMSILYGMTGSLELARVVEAVEVGNPTLLAFGLVFVVAGLAFKLGVAPFHMWVPDIYHGAPSAVTLFIGSAPKLAAFAIVMRLLVDGLHPAVGDWQQMLAIMAVLSLMIGNLAAIMQTNIKRMLAYSTIAHMGFLLLGVLADSYAGYSAAMFYVITYALMSLGAFGMVVYLSRAGFEAENLDDFKGLNARHPWLAAVMAMVMLSLAGLPPFVGFYAKLTVLQALVGAGWLWLAVIAVIFSLIGAFYYLRVVKVMYFDAPHATDLAPSGEADVRALLSANGLGVLVLGLMPQPLLALCAYAIQVSIQ
ncbi:NADH dehydrogenase subunit N [Sulfuritortus calidifontis]|uniref:NADH-quinone oxidoreductase subunit N n=1 Tax=Sulfuritortus calidifontis TaxID=1914471 RepID=A0A4V2UQL5_9PROT|nr:NADH-quinone oxidoreductase subunit NuoN [Sulfuritortus calidifontis]TCS71347.1 NADH dehydrogenase subunit N [Sulfuritortus calidifontis]